MSINEIRNSIAKIFNKVNIIRNNHFIYLVDDKDNMKIEEVKEDEIYTIVTTKSYGKLFYSKIYLDFGDINPEFCGKENIHPDDVKTICKRYNKLNGDEVNRLNFTYGYLLSRIMLYNLIKNCYTLNLESFRNYIGNFPIPSKEITIFFSRLEFPLKINSCMKLLLDKIITSDNILEIIMFKTGFPRFTYNDLDIILKSHKLNKPFQIYKITNNLFDNESYLEYFDVCIRNFEGTFDNNKVIIYRDKTKNILYELFSRKYEKIEEIDKVRKIVNHYLDIGGNINIELDEYFSEEEINTYFTNKNTFLS